MSQSAKLGEVHGAKRNRSPAAQPAERAVTRLPTDGCLRTMLARYSVVSYEAILNAYN